MGAVVVVEQHLRRRLDRAGEDVPGRRSEGLSVIEEAHVRHAARRDDDDVGVLRQDVGRLGIGVAAEGDAEPRAFGEAPVDDAHDLAPPLQTGGNPDLPAGFGPRLEHDDRMAALAGDSRRLEAGRPRADDDDLALGPAAPGDHVRDRRLAPGRGIVDADRLAR